MLGLHSNTILLTLSLVQLAFQESSHPSPPSRIAEQQTFQVGEVGARIVSCVKRSEAFGFSGAVLAAKDGAVVAAVAVGHADLEGRVPNTPSTLFEIASATKQFTAAAAVRLVQDGKLRLDDPIARYLPGVPDSCSSITVRHLLQQTSGIPGTNTDGRGDDLATVLPLFLRGGPRHQPGTHFEYWNQGYSLLSEIIARSSGTAYTTFCREALFDPAGMAATRFTGDAPPPIEGVIVAVGRSASGAPRGALDPPYGNAYGFEYRGMGGVVTSVWDLWRWDRALHENGQGSLLGPDAQAALFTPGLDNYALGWFVRNDIRGRTIQSHGGHVRAFVCEIRRLPDDNGCLFVLANQDDAPVRQLADSVQAILLGPPYACVELPLPLDAELEKAVVGRYKDSAGNVLEVKAKAPAVRVTVTWVRNPGLTTRAFLGSDSSGDLVLFEWTSTTRASRSHNPQGAVQSLTISGATFVRVP